MSSIYRIIERRVTTPGTPVAVGHDAEKFNTGIFRAQRSETESNAGAIWIEIVGSSSGSGVDLGPGEVKVFHAPNKTFFRASQFQIDGQFSGDGVQLSYAYADWKTFNNVEYKLEVAIRRLIETIRATFDDCSVTTGLSDEQKEGDSIVCSVQSSNEWRRDTGRWICAAEIFVTSSVDGDNAREKHLLRTAYVRDLIMDSTLAQNLSSLGEGLTVFPGTVDEFESTTEVDSETRRWISRLRFNVHCCGSTIFILDDQEDVSFIGAFGGGWIGDVDGNKIGAF